MRTLRPYLRRYWGLAVLALVFAAIHQLLQLVDPLIVRKVLDDYVLRHREYTSAQFLRGVGVLMLGAVLVAVVARMARSLQEYFIRVVTHRIGADLYSDGVRHSLALPYAQFADHRSGETFGKLQKVRADVEKLITSTIGTLFTTCVALVFVTVYAFTLHWIIVPVFLAMVPVLGALSSFLARRIKSFQQEILTETATLAGSTTESLRNIELVKSLGLANQEIERLDSVTDRIVELELRKVRTLRLYSFVQSSSVVGLRSAVMMMMLYLIYSGDVTVGEWLSFLLYATYIFGPLQDLGPAIAAYREAEASLDSFERILTTPVEVRPLRPVALGSVHHLAFEGVGFSYDAVEALVDVSFEARRGETVAFVGPSGSGKSTLVKLLAGLYAPRHGRILYNGETSDAIDLDELRRQMGLVAQDPQLFSGSIRSNLLFASPEASDGACLAVLRQAACGDLLARGGTGLDTVIGEGGIKLSGGERQRLSIARALLREPRLLVFDEATSSLDSLTEEEVTATIRGVSSAQRITILIAHRLSTVFHADVIHVLEQGRIIETGRHRDLLAKRGLYYAMWRQQIGERRPHSSVTVPVGTTSFAPPAHEATTR